MKRFGIFFLLAGLSIAGSSFAQELRLNAVAGYTFDDRFDSYFSPTAYYEGQINGGLQWGGGLEYLLRPNYGIELSYLRMDTKAPTLYYDNRPPGVGLKSEDFDLGINYIMLGGNGYLRNNQMVEPYFGAQIGMAITNVSRPAGIVEDGFDESETNTKFAWGVKGGANIWPGGPSGRIGIKLQASLLSAVQSVGGGFYFGTGGSGVGISSYSSFLQFTLGGGLTFRLSGGQTPTQRTTRPMP